MVFGQGASHENHRRDGFSDAGGTSSHPLFAQPLLWAGLFGLFGLLLSSCTSPIHVKPLSSDKAHELLEENILSSDEPSRQTLQTLRLFFMEKVWKKDPVIALESLDRSINGANRKKLLPALAELALFEALDKETRHPEEAVQWFLMATLRSYQYLFQSPEDHCMAAFDNNFQFMRSVYNDALAHYIKLVQIQYHGRLPNHEGSFLGNRVYIHIYDDHPLWEQDLQDTIRPSHECKIQGLRNHYSRTGMGAAFTLTRENRDDHPTDAYFPPEGVVYPATAVFDLAAQTPEEPDQEIVATIYMLDPRQREYAPIWGQEVPLAADFTTPFGYLLAQSKLEELSFRGLTNAEKVEDRFGLFLNEPYDPQKIPVIMVHGLFSSPIVWMDITNDLAGEEFLRKNFQVWHYRYPTGLPYLFSASTFRNELEKLRSSLDPEGDDPAMQDMVIVAHSMGGLLAKTLITESGTDLWDVMFKQAPETLKGRPEDLNLLKQVFFFEPKPYVNRVIFIATPHRGSSSANGVLGRFGASIVKLPERFDDWFHRVIDENRHLVTEAYLKGLERREANSINLLAPENPSIQAFAKLPFGRGKHYHSIIGDRGQADGTKGSDGMVSYESAHLEGAESETIVPTGHSGYSHPLTLAEVKRILRLHLQELTARKEIL